MTELLVLKLKVAPGGVQAGRPEKETPTSAD